MLNTVQKIETEVTALSEKDLCAFRAWFQKFDAAHRDEQLACDVRAGKLNELAAEALEQYGNGQCKHAPSSTRKTASSGRPGSKSQNISGNGGSNALL